MIFRRLETYIIYRIASSLLILGFFFFAIVILEFEIPTWVLVRPPCRFCRVMDAAHPTLIRRTAHVHQAWQACGVACLSKVCSITCSLQQVDAAWPPVWPVAAVCKYHCAEPYNNANPAGGHLHHERCVRYVHLV